MIFGHDKYEPYQDTTPAKILAGLVLLKLNEGNDVDADLKEMALEVLRAPPHPPTTESLKTMMLHSMVHQAGIPENEPVFLLRSKDPLSLITVQCWIHQAKECGVSAERILSAERQLQAMRDYRAFLTGHQEELHFL